MWNMIKLKCLFSDKARGWEMGNRPIASQLRSIRLHLHASWYLVVIMIAGILVTQFPVNYPLPERILFGLLGGLLFLASLTVIQVLNNLAAILVRIPVRNCTLFAFGGVTPVPEGGTSPGREIVMAVVKFLLNLIMAAIFNWLNLSQSSTNNPQIVLLVQWLAFFWYMLAIVHILPAFPLVGGRILAALVWKATGNYMKSMWLAASIGSYIGICLSLGGIALLVLSGQVVNGLLLIFFGWALQRGAAFSSQRAALLGILQNTTAKNIMTKEFPSIGPGLNLEELIRDYVLVTGRDFFAIADQGKLLGIVTARNIKQVPKNRWGSTLVGTIMTPWRVAGATSGEQPAAHVLEKIDQFGVDHLPIAENGDIIGVVIRDDLYRLARIRVQLKI
jgi:CBS domain-containing protein